MTSVVKSLFHIPVGHAEGQRPLCCLLDEVSHQPDGLVGPMTGFETILLPKSVIKLALAQSYQTTAVELI